MTRREIHETVRQYRDAWRDCLERMDGEASQRENWDGSDHNICAFDRLMDALLTLPTDGEKVAKS